MAVGIPLKLVYTPVDATVTAIRNYQVPSTKVKAHWQGGVKHLLFGCERPKNECFTLPTVGKEHALDAFTSRGWHY